MAEPGVSFHRWETPFENARFLILSVAHQPVLWFCNADRNGFEDADPLCTWDELVVTLCDLDTLDVWSVRFEQVAAVHFHRDGAGEIDFSHRPEGVDFRCCAATGTPLACRNRGLSDAVSYLLGTHTQGLEVLTVGPGWAPKVEKTGRARLSERVRHSREKRDVDGAEFGYPGAVHLTTREAVLLQASATPGHLGDDGAIHAGTEVWMHDNYRVILW